MKTSVFGLWYVQLLLNKGKKKRMKAWIQRGYSEETETL